MRGTAAATRRTGVRAGLSLGAALLLVVVAWFYFAPVQVGGTFSYFQVVGDSMEPTIVRGDLVLLRQQDRYVPGDMVAYQDPDLGTVLHRIREVRGEHFVLRGDNRESDDSFQPTQSEITGGVWQILPNAGNALATAQSPAGAIFFGGSSLLMGAISWGRRSEGGEARRKPRKNPRSRASFATGTKIADRSPTGGSMLSAAGLALVVAFLAGAMVVMNPSEEIVMRDFAYEHTGEFSYTGVAGQGIYDGNEVSTGDPVFTRMTTDVPITFAYRILALSNGISHIVEPSGNIRLDAVVSQDNGWARTVQLTDWTPFAGDEARVSGNLNLEEILSLTKMMETFSGLAYPTYTVEVQATVEIAGGIVNQPFKGDYQAGMRFLLSDAQLMPATNFESTSMGPVTVSRPVEQPWSVDVPILGVTIDWSTMRLLALGAGLTAIALVGIVLASTAFAARSGEVTLIAARYGAVIVDAASTEVTFAGRRVQVRQIEDLVKMARQDGLFIVHEHQEHTDDYDITRVTHHYHLVQPDVTYTYTVGPIAMHPGTTA